MWFELHAVGSVVFFCTQSSASQVSGLLIEMHPSVRQWNGGLGWLVAVSQMTLVAPGSVQLCIQSRLGLVSECALRLYATVKVSFYRWQWHRCSVVSAVSTAAFTLHDSVTRSSASS